MEDYFKYERFKNVPEEKLDEIYVNKRIKMPVSPKDMVFFLDRENGDVNMRVLPYHHRSADIGVSTVIREKKAEQDNIFCQIDVKGGGFVFPEEHESKKDSLKKGSLANAPEAMIIPGSQETPWGYDALGLFDERMANGTVKIAESLSELGMRTEGIAGIYRLKELMVNGEVVSVKDFKSSEGKKLRQMAKEEKTEEEKEKYKEMAKNLEIDFDPVVMIRLMRSVFRLRDTKEALQNSNNQALLQVMLEEACRNLNIENEELGLTERFDAKSPEGREKWLQYITHWYGKNVGILHGQGLIHMFLHMGNLTLAGEIVDLDSVSTIVEKKKFTGKIENREKWLRNPEHADGGGAYISRPFFKETKEGCAFISESAGRYQLPDSRFGLPKLITKDIRDICFSVRVFLKEVMSKMPHGKYVDKTKIAQSLISGYTQGIHEKNAFQEIDISSEKLIEVFKEVAQEVVGRGEHYAPIPTDDGE